MVYRHRRVQTGMKLRIIAGSLKGMPLVTPSGHKTHPMSEKLRSVIFNVLGDIDGLTVLDAFAGTGAVGLESSSRGAERVTLIENDKKAQLSILSNIQSTAATNVKLIKAPVFSWSDKNPSEKFDLIIADPPFDDIPHTAVAKLAGHLNRGGVLVLNYPAELKPPEMQNLQQVKLKTHGIAQLIFYKN